MGVWIAARYSRTMGTAKRAVLTDCDPPERDDGVPTMSPADLPDDDSLPPEDLARVIAACDRFEAEWNAGRPGRIEPRESSGTPTRSGYEHTSPSLTWLPLSEFLVAGEHELLRFQRLTVIDRPVLAADPRLDP
jgi:hypothetical protein